MKKNKELQKILKAFPNLKGNKMIADLSYDLNKVKDISVISRSEGGKALAEKIRTRAEGTLNLLMQIYKEVSRDEIVSLLASYEAHINLYDDFVRAIKVEKDLQTEIDKAIIGE